MCLLTCTVLQGENEFQHVVINPDGKPTSLKDAESLAPPRLLQGICGASGTMHIWRHLTSGGIFYSIVHSFKLRVQRAMFNLLIAGVCIYCKCALRTWKHQHMVPHISPWASTKRIFHHWLIRKRFAGDHYGASYSPVQQHQRNLA